jgi:hypothetical protein
MKISVFVIGILHIIGFCNCSNENSTETQAVAKNVTTNPLFQVIGLQQQQQNFTEINSSKGSFLLSIF